MYEATESAHMETLADAAYATTVRWASAIRRDGVTIAVAFGDTSAEAIRMANQIADALNVD